MVFGLTQKRSFNRFFFLVVALCCFDSGALAAENEAKSNVVAEYFPQFNGLVIRSIEVIGLQRSRPFVVRWMLGGREGDLFDAQLWQNGIERLYKTEALYEIHTEITLLNKMAPGELAIRVFITDKWTLFPYFDFQGGGGSLSLSAGVFDSNLLGTFANFAVGGGYLDHAYSYEVSLFQKWFLLSNYSLGLDVSKINLPVSVQNDRGDLLESFTWSRTKQEIFVGNQNGEDFYWEIHASTFRDSLRDPTPRTILNLIPEVRQYRLSPSLRFGKVAHSDYLEQGQEFTANFAASNVGNSERDFYSTSLSWKQVFFLPDTKNLAYFIHLNHTNQSPLAYQFRLGGFDSVRGFSTNRTIGLDTVRANFEYRSTFWAHRFEWLDLGRVVFQSCLFTDIGSSWSSAGIDLSSGVATQKGSRLLYSAGAGIRAIFLHFSNAILRLDMAKAIFPNEGYNVGFGVGQFF